MMYLSVPNECYIVGGQLYLLSYPSPYIVSPPFFPLKNILHCSTVSYMAVDAIVNKLNISLTPFPLGPI